MRAEQGPGTRVLGAVQGALGDRHIVPPRDPATTWPTRDLTTAYDLGHTPNPVEFYGRFGNPAGQAFERAMADLEGAEASRAFASGMGAINAIILGLTSSGDHIVAQKQLYGGTLLLLNLVKKFGIDTTLVDATEPGAFAAAVIPGKTVIVFAETPANPKLDLVDLEEVGAIRGPMTVVDSTLATPLGINPHEFGIDLVVHSATKGIAGHNNATLGVTTGSKELVDWLWGYAILQGANASPADAENALNGLKTLNVRLKQQSANALELARYLEGHPAVTEVRYPGLKSHPQHDLARRQMHNFGGLLTFDHIGGKNGAARFAESLKIAILATSLGGPETLVTHPASTTHAGLTPEEFEEAGIGPGTIRVSCGLEDASDIVADFEQALDAA